MCGRQLKMTGERCRKVWRTEIGRGCRDRAGGDKTDTEIEVTEQTQLFTYACVLSCGP